MVSVGDARVLGIIPAKGGSTRFPRKNITLLSGQTLLERCARAMLDAKILDDLVVSSESEEVLDVAYSLGLKAPFIRPSELAKDPAGVVHVVQHTIDELAKSGEIFDTVVVCLPTCPLRDAGDVVGAYNLFRETATTVMSISEFTHTPFAAQKVTEGGQLEPWFPDFWGRKSQEMPRAYRPNGAVHVVDVDVLRATSSMLGPPVVGYEMPRERSIDIDTEADLHEAATYLARLHEA